MFRMNQTNLDAISLQYFHLVLAFHIFIGTHYTAAEIQPPA